MGCSDTIVLSTVITLCYLRHCVILCYLGCSDTIVLFTFQSDPWMQLLGMGNSFKFDDDDNYRYVMFLLSQHLSYSSEGIID